MRLCLLEPGFFNEENIGYTQLQVRALMTFAGDEAKAQQFCDGILADAITQSANKLEETNESLELDNSIVRLLRTAPRVGEQCDMVEQHLIRSQDGQRVHWGTVAGWTMLIPLLLKAKRGVNVGPGASRKVLHALLKTGKRPFRGTAERTLKTIWTKYLPVAHLWAAQDLLDDLQPLSEGSAGLMRLLALAEAIRELAENHFVKGTGETDQGNSPLLAPGAALKILCTEDAAAYPNWDMGLGFYTAIDDHWADIALA